jgi:UDP:flavonoid glycosyltransferase YjiC (YdhE family)
MQPAAHQQLPYRILVAPLDWGLGHAVRCIPIIRRILADGHQVFLAVTPSTEPVLQQAFPDLPRIDIPAYNVRYPFRNMLINGLVQAPRMLKTALREHSTIKEVVREHRIDAILSDNRMGCFFRGIANVYITHQYTILIPNFLLRAVANWCHRRVIDQFSSLWIPDRNDPFALGPAMSRVPPKKQPFYVGWLSEAEPVTGEGDLKATFILSGPEPQRTRLEQRILAEAKSLEGPFALVRGVTNNQALSGRPESIPLVHDLADRKTIQGLVNRSEVIVARSGYTTLMDLAFWRKPALLIPTTGQYEQEYLADRMQESGWAHTTRQEALQLGRDLQLARLGHMPELPEMPDQGLRSALDDLYQLISD